MLKSRSSSLREEKFNTGVEFFKTCLGKPRNKKKNGKKRGQCHPRGEGRHPQYLFLAQIYQGLKSLENALCTLTN